MDSKNSFVIYDNWASLLCDLPNEQAGELIKAICAYKLGQFESLDDPVISAIFNMIKQKLDEDSQKYQEVCEKRKEAGRKGGTASESKNKQTQANGKQTEANGSKCLSETSKSEQMPPDTDTVTDTDNDNDNDTDTDDEL